MPRAGKGSEFERSICKQLSLWWTSNERDDVYWRSSQSGGRATQRSKQGKRTYGSYGDIASVDPIGEPLLKVFTIELKRGSSYSSPGDLLDFKDKNGSHPWVKCIAQAIKSHRQCGSRSWMMICKRDHRLPIVYISTEAAKLLHVSRPFIVRFKYFLQTDEGRLTLDFVGLRLESFLQRVKPGQIIKLCRQLKLNI